MTTKRHLRGFTLIEVVVVLGIILVLVGLTAGIATHVVRKGERDKTLALIRNLGNACQRYQADYGTFPQSADTDALDPRATFNPNTPAYTSASRHLYTCLSGNGGQGNRYHDFQPSQLSKTTRGPNPPLVTPYIIDSFGYCLGYSSAGNVDENDYRQHLRADSQASRPNPPKGYNPTFDLWSTTGATSEDGAAKWIKNWNGE